MTGQATPPGASRPTTPLTSGELASTMSHFHRAEIARMAGWRDRLDRTTNWAITVVAAMLSVSLSTPTSHHGVLLFAMLLILLLLWIEARRYRFFDVYRARVRQFERHYFAQIFSPQPDFASNWLIILGESLRTPEIPDLAPRVLRSAPAAKLHLHVSDPAPCLGAEDIDPALAGGGRETRSRAVADGSGRQCQAWSPAGPGCRRDGRGVLCRTAGRCLSHGEKEGELAHGNVHV